MSEASEDPVILPSNQEESQQTPRARRTVIIDPPLSPRTRASSRASEYQAYAESASEGEDRRVPRGREIRRATRVNAAEGGGRAVSKKKVSFAHVDPPRVPIPVDYGYGFSDDYSPTRARDRTIEQEQYLTHRVLERPQTRLHELEYDTRSRRSLPRARPDVFIYNSHPYGVDEDDIDLRRGRRGYSRARELEIRLERERVRQEEEVLMAREQERQESYKRMEMQERVHRRAIASLEARRTQRDDIELRRRLELAERERLLLEERRLVHHRKEQREMERREMEQRAGELALMKRHAASAPRREPSRSEINVESMDSALPSVSSRPSSPYESLDLDANENSEPKKDQTHEDFLSRSAINADSDQSETIIDLSLEDEESAAANISSGRKRRHKQEKGRIVAQRARAGRKRYLQDLQVATPEMATLWQTKRRSWIPPKDIHGRRNLAYEFNLGSEWHRLRWKGRTETWPSEPIARSERARPDQLHVLASTSYSDEVGDSAIELKCDDIIQSSTEYFYHWVHIPRHCMDLDVFKTTALQTPGISDDMALVVGQLLKQVKKDLERPFVHGKYIEPGAVRYDGYKASSRSQENCSATFFSIPYFQLQRIDATNGSLESTRVSHPTRALVQSQYDGESTFERDSSQYLRNIKSSMKQREVLQVPNFWCLVLGEDAMVTSSADDLDALLSPTVTRVSRRAGASQVELVKVIDPYGRPQFLPFMRCRSFFELQQAVLLEVLPNTSFDFHDCDIHCGGLVLSDVEAWKVAISSETSPIITIKIVKKKPIHLLTEVAHNKIDDASSTTLQTPMKSIVGSRLFNPPESLDGSDLTTETTSLSRTQSRANSISSPDTKEAIDVLLAKKDNENIRLDMLEKKIEEDMEDRIILQKHVDDLKEQGLILNGPITVFPQKSVRIYRRPTWLPDGNMSSRSSDSPSLPSSPVPQMVGQDSTSTLNRADQSMNEQSNPHEMNYTESEWQLVRVPRLAPFLTWKLDGDLQDVKDSDNIREHLSLTRLHYVLDRVESKITHRDAYKVDPSGNMSRLFATYRAELIWDRTPKVTYADFVSQRKTLQKLEQSRQEAIIQRTPMPLDGERPTDSGAFKQTSRHLDPYVSQQDKKISAGVHTLLRQVEDISACFVPSSYSHTVLSKLWGSLTRFLFLCSTARYDNEEGLDDSAATSWTIRDVVPTSVSELMDTDIPMPSVSWSSCPSCSDHRLYDTKEEALEHLRTDHFYHGTLDLSKVSSLSFWVCTPVLKKASHENSDVLQYLDRFLKHTAKLHDDMNGLMDALNDDMDNEGTKKSHELPSALVRAFEAILIFILAASHTMLIQERHQTIDSSFRLLNHSRRKNDLKVRLLRLLGLRAEMFMSEALKDVILMMRTGSVSEAVKFFTVGPRYVALAVCRSLLQRKLGDDNGALDWYRKCGSKLKYDVYHKAPRRRRLQDIQLLAEEVGAAHATRILQLKTMEQFAQINDPGSFRVSNQSRLRQFALEEEMCAPLRKTLEAEIEDFKDLLRMLDILERKARYRIDVLEEDNSKTVFVFTVITAVFLPLSFFSSYLGMNTADIRSTNSSQKLFWAVGLPLTVATVGLAVFAANNSDALVEWVHELTRKPKKDRRVGGGKSDLSTVTESKTDVEKETVNDRLRSRFGRTKSDVGDTVV